MNSSVILNLHILKTIEHDGYNDKLQKENQTLRNEVKELKNKLQKVSDDLSKSQVG